MINCQFRIINGTYYPQFRVQSLSDALNACLFILCDLNIGNDWYVALSSLGNDRRSFPNIHIQTVNGRAFLQVFMDESHSPDGQEGWFTLFEDEGVLNCQFFCLLDDLPKMDSQFFEAGFAQGIAFTKKFLVNENAVVDHIKRFLVSDQKEWLNEGNWLNLGLL